MNVLLIVCDALRYDHFNPKYMPNLSRLSEVGVNFTRCFSIGGNTPLSMPGIFCSQKLYDKEKNLPTVLQSHGYTTGMIQSCPIHRDFRYGFMVKKISYSGENFQRVRQFLDKRGLLGRVRRALRTLRKIKIKGNTYTPKGDAVPYRRVEHLLQETEKLMHIYNTPWFHWVQLMDPHIPYMPLGYDGMNRIVMRELNDKILDSVHRGYVITDEERDKLKILYGEEIKYMDEHLGRFLMYMFKNRPKTLMIVTSDHGDEFGEYGWYSHSPGAHGPTQQLLHVPLIMFGLGVMGRVVEDYVSHLDIAPTILDYVGIDKKIGYGKSLRSFMK